MRKDEVRRILQKKYSAYRDEVVGIIKSLPPESRQSGDDSGLDDVWEEFKFQVQREESVTFDLYAETIEAFCKDVAKNLPDHELELLWLDSATYFDHDDDHGPAARGELIAGVTQEIYGKVLEMANNEELKFDHDEEHQVAMFEEDLAPYRATPDEHSD